MSETSSDNTLNDVMEFISHIKSFSKTMRYLAEKDTRPMLKAAEKRVDKEDMSIWVRSIQAMQIGLYVLQTRDSFICSVYKPDEPPPNGAA